ncbi:MAG: hypothetical protein PHI87_00115 [Candidatus Methanomethylophilus sp.]|nr:hypothetical protein [Methanomethylophilus sp.]
MTEKIIKPVKCRAGSGSAVVWVPRTLEGKLVEIRVLSEAEERAYMKANT